MGGVSWSLFLRASLAQAIAVGVLFALLLALPLPSEFFREQGAWVGPVSWLACALFAARAVGLGAPRAVAAAAVSGLAAIAASMVLGHSAGMVAGVLTFGMGCAARVGWPGEGGASARGAGLGLEAEERAALESPSSAGSR
jgi:hypothetical protein